MPRYLGIWRLGHSPRARRQSRRRALPLPSPASGSRPSRFAGGCAGAFERRCRAGNGRAVRLPWSARAKGAEHLSSGLSGLFQKVIRGFGFGFLLGLLGLESGFFEALAALGQFPFHFGDGGGEGALLEAGLFEAFDALGAGVAVFDAGGGDADAEAVGHFDDGLLLAEVAEFGGGFVLLFFEAEYRARQGFEDGHEGFAFSVGAAR